MNSKDLGLKVWNEEILANRQCALFQNSESSSVAALLKV